MKITDINEALDLFMFPLLCQASFYVKYEKYVKEAKNVPASNPKSVSEEFFGLREYTECTVKNWDEIYEVLGVKSNDMFMELSMFHDASSIEGFVINIGTPANIYFFNEEERQSPYISDSRTVDITKKLSLSKYAMSKRIITICLIEQVNGK